MAMLSNPAICPTNTMIDVLICSTGIGSSKKLLHAAMCVVKRKGWIFASTGTSNVPMMVKRMIKPMVETIGPMELSEKQEKVRDNVAIITKARYATTKP